MSDSLLIKDRGVIEELEIPVPQGGGVVVLRGKNGHGKTTALKVIHSLVTGEKGPGVRRGATKGSTIGFGVEVKIASRESRKGTLTVTGFRGAESLTKFLNPGVKDEEVADARRIAEMIRMTGATISGHDWVAKFGDDVRACVDATDPIATAAAVTKYLQAKARELEAEADKASGSAAALEALASGELEKPEFTEEEAQKRHLEAVRAQAAVDDRVRAAKVACESIEKAERKLAEERQKVVGDLDEVNAEVGRLDGVVYEARGIVEGIKKKIAELQSQLVDAEAAVKSSMALHVAATDKRIAIQKHCESLKSLEQQVNQQRPSVPQDEVDAAASAVSNAMEDLRIAQEFKANAARIEKAKQHREQQKQHAEKAVKLRELADKTDEVLASAVAKIAPQIRISKGRLWAKNSHGAEVYVSELSPGERATLGLDIAIAAAESGAAGVIDQEAWESLDPDNQEHVRRHAKERGILIYAAQAGPESEIVAEVLGGDGDEAPADSESAESTESLVF